MPKLQNIVYSRTLKGYYLSLADCGACLDNLKEAIARLPVEWTNVPQHADLVFMSGVISTALGAKLKQAFNSFSKPFFIIKIGGCMGPMNKIFEDPANNYAVLERAKKFFPIDLLIEGCPPTVDEIYDKLESFITFIDLTPTISKTLERKMDKGIFNP
jgi:Ni,Fe-hydrogenase III small subunit